MSDRHIDSMAPGTEPQPPQVLSTARPEEGPARGEGWMVIRALLLILGGIAIVSYVMMTIDS
ncbi:hypothetical protein EJV46_11720 [Roseococcus sp. SYP-B2431]|uniref:hypothetical protein n=1 Tax=Roseococcus sp. SYP-B2431 TaxID=2496640 RepID=UPI00103BE5F4|nr:hypothetical protein [Roseococcus sp. SYP-B2431]TCH97887.1 hypothetical protein EJV46_11720 [Roseococcus sp. SYP-B2431]